MNNARKCRCDDALLESCDECHPCGGETEVDNLRKALKNCRHFAMWHDQLSPNERFEKIRIIASNALDAGSAPLT